MQLYYVSLLAWTPGGKNLPELFRIEKPRFYGRVNQQQHQGAIRCPLQV